MTESQLDSIVSLPGGVTSYAETLRRATEYAATAEPTEKEFQTWFLQTFDNMSTEGSALDKLRLLKQLDVVEEVDGRFVATEFGREVVDSGGPNPILQYLFDNYIGFDIILEELSETQQTTSELNDQLMDQLGKDWETTQQAEYRLNWLRSLGVIDLEGKEYRLTPKGRELAGDLELTGQVPQVDSVVDAVALGDQVDWYWVNQKNRRERDGEYLQSSDTKWQRDLTQLSEGDILLHYWDDAIRAWSQVTTEAGTVELDDGEYYRVDVDLHELSTPKQLNEINDALRRPEVKQDKNRYAINTNGGVQSWYICHLTPTAGRYILTGELPDEDSTENYYWINASPRKGSVPEADGEEIFYTTVNSRDRKRNYQNAFESASAGDRLLLYVSSPKQEITAEGTVIEGLHEEETRGFDHPVEGITVKFESPIDGISWEDVTDVPALEDSMPLKTGARGTLFELTEEEFNTILGLESESGPVDDEAVNALRTKLTLDRVSIEIPSTLHFEDEKRLRREIEAALNAGENIIFTGPPGTGKTKLAKEICGVVADDDELPAVDGYTFSTATAEWTAFDTIGGYVPSRTGDAQDLVFEPRLFLQCFRQGHIVNEWLIIDEINRSDIDKAFGQLFSVLSGDSTELPYERDETVELRSLPKDATDAELEEVVRSPDIFPVMPSWRLIATMNTYDKASLYEMSYAFMRRFSFIHVGIPDLRDSKSEGTDVVRTSLLDPNHEEDNYATAWLSSNEELRSTLERLYPELTVIWERINRERAIGPAIVYDILKYVDAYDTGSGTDEEALTSAILALVYPQLEGLRPEIQRGVITALSQEQPPIDSGSVSVSLDNERLRKQATEILNLTFEDAE